MKYPKPLVVISDRNNYMGTYLQGVFLWNAYARGVLTEEQYEIGVTIARDGYHGHPLELVEVARKL